MLKLIAKVSTDFGTLIAMLEISINNKNLSVLYNHFNSLKQNYF